MSYEIMKTCADMVITAAIQDKAERENRDIDSVRHELIVSEAYDSLYNFETELWKEGPDYLLDFFEQVEAVKKGA